MLSPLYVPHQAHVGDYDNNNNNNDDDDSGVDCSNSSSWCSTQNLLLLYKKSKNKGIFIIHELYISLIHSPLDHLLDW